MFQAFLVYNIEILIPVPPHFSCGVGASRQTWTASRTARLPHVFLHVPLRFPGLVYSSVDGRAAKLSASFLVTHKPFSYDLCNRRSHNSTPDAIDRVLFNLVTHCSHRSPFLYSHRAPIFSAKVIILRHCSCRPFFATSALALEPLLTQLDTGSFMRHVLFPWDPHAIPPGRPNMVSATRLSSKPSTKFHKT